jgi:hypothetical protein
MAFISAPKDLSAVKNRIAFNMTKRQLVCFSVAAVIGIPTYIVSRGALGNEGSVLLMIGLMLPMFFVAMYEKDGQPAEKVLRNFIRTRFAWPSVRPYQTNNLYEYLVKEGKISGKENKTAKKTPCNQHPPAKTQ